MTTLLGSSAMVIQYGISGSYWYAVGGGIQLVLFAYLTFAMKLRAPGILRTLIKLCEIRLTSWDIRMLAVVSNLTLILGAKTALQYIKTQYGTVSKFLNYTNICI